MYKKIYCNGKYSHIYTTVDLEDYKWLCNKYRLYYDINTGYIQAYNLVSKKMKLLHRLILNITDRKIPVDHKNGNRKNNRRNNIRLCTYNKNLMNRDKIKSATSKYKGICWNKRVEKWRVRLSLGNRKCTYDSYFDNEILAAKRYDQLASKYYGDFAKLNFPEDRDYSDVDEYLKSIKPNKSSNYIGVSKCKNKWGAFIQIKKNNQSKTIALGLFNTEIEAALAYDEGLDKYKTYRTKLKYNFPKSGVKE